MVKNRFKNILPKASRYSVSLRRLKVSNEKVEKVVSPPQKPTPINNFKLLDNKSFSSNPNIRIPRIILPIKFTIKVPKGKYAGSLYEAYVERKYLNAPPIPAPMPTSK